MAGDNWYDEDEGSPAPPVKVGGNAFIRFFEKLLEDRNLDLEYAGKVIQPVASLYDPSDPEYYRYRTERAYGLGVNLAAAAINLQGRLVNREVAKNGTSPTTIAKVKKCIVTCSIANEIRFSRDNIAPGAALGGTQVAYALDTRSIDDGNNTPSVETLDNKFQFEYGAFTGIGTGKPFVSRYLPANVPVEIDLSLLLLSDNFHLNFWLLTVGPCNLYVDIDWVEKPIGISAFKGL